MTKEEFDKLEDKWQTVYLDGKTPIRMVSKRSSKEDCILWYDSDEYAHTAHYSRIETKQCDHQKAIDTFAKEKYPLEDGMENAHWNARQCELREAFKAGFLKSEEVFLKKACEWLKDELDKLAMDKVDEDFLQNEFKVITKEDVPIWIDDFSKAMKGERNNEY